VRLPGQAATQPVSLPLKGDRDHARIPLAACAGFDVTALMRF